MQEVLAIVFIFGGGAVFLLAISPIGRAIADRIRSNPAVAGDDSVRRLQETQQAILDDLEAVRQELGEVQERLDFTERLLARQREAPRLDAGESEAAKPATAPRAPGSA
jgi:Tfp pilus assembly protein PilO